jgi:hypothetical protein
MKTIFPQTTSKNWAQQNKGDMYPVLFSTRNINLEKRGYIGLSRRMSYLMKNGGLSTLIPAIQVHTVASRYKIASTGGNMYDLTYNLQTITQDTDATTLSQYTDIKTFGSATYYTQSATSSLYWRAGGSGAYSTIAAGLNTGGPHPMEIFETKNLLCIGNTSAIVCITSGNTVSPTVLSIPSNFTIVDLTYFNNRMYVATVSQNGADATLFEWDGSSASANFGYKIAGRSIVSMCVYDQSVCLLTSRGELLRFNGGGFVQLATLPFFQDKDASWAYQPAILDHQAQGNSMDVVDEYLYINVSNNILIKNNQYEVIPSFPAGIYQYHPDFGLVHKLSLSQSSINTVTDYGQTYGNFPNAIRRLQDAGSSYPNSPTYANGTRFLAGATLTDSSLVENTYLLSMTSGESRGEFVTSKIFSSNITDNQQTVTVKFKNLIDSTDKIIVKYKYIDKKNYPIVLTPTVSRAVTWVNNTTFTSTDTKMADVSIGDEVSVMSGNGAGSLAHITNIQFSLGTYTVTLDEQIIGILNGNMSGVFIDNWVKLQTITSSNMDGFEEITIGGDSKWIQLKFELRGSNEPMIEEIQLIGKGYQD